MGSMTPAADAAMRSPRGQGWGRSRRCVRAHGHVGNQAVPPALLQLGRETMMAEARQVAQRTQPGALCAARAQLLATSPRTTSMLMTKSRHTSLRSLQKYVGPGTDALAALTAAHDPERRVAEHVTTCASGQLPEHVAL